MRCIASSPALDVVAVGLADGRCVLRNLRYDEHLMTFSNAAGAGVNPERITGHDAVGIKDHGLGKAAAGLTVTALSFRTGPGKPLLAAGGSAGVVTVWNLDERRLEHVIKDAHDGALLQLFFFPGEPVLMSSATDNSGEHPDSASARLHICAGLSPSHHLSFSHVPPIPAPLPPHSPRIFSTPSSSYHLAFGRPPHRHSQAVSL